MKAKLALLILGTFLPILLIAQTAELEPAASTVRQDSLIEVATGLHDMGNFDEAIKFYKSVLEENPANITALYEMSFSYFAKGDYGNCIKYSAEGLKYKSKLLPLFYMNMGSSLDIQGQTNEAIKVFENGIRIEPDNYLLRYNLALACFNKKDYEKAVEAVQSALKLKPTHPGSNLLLGTIYMNSGKKVAAVLAFSRFLSLEPATGRSGAVMQYIEQILASYVTKKDSMNFNISINPNAADEVNGDLGILETALALSHAARNIDKSEANSEIKSRIKEFKSLFRIMSETAGKQERKGFVWEYYAPYFIDLEKQGLTEAFVYYIYNCSGQDEIKNWIGNNTGEINKLIAWNKSYTSGK